MDGFEALFANKPLIAALLGWIIAQAAKVLLNWLFFKKWDPQRFFGSGGMPSSHASFMCALSTSIGISLGFQSAEFAICAAFSIIVMYDASGVRRAAGKQAAVINRIVQDMATRGSGFTTAHLKELIGHTPFEVIMGALLGILIGIFVMW